MRNLKKIAFIFVISIIVLSVLNLSNAETGVVDTAAVRIREKASTDSKILTKAYEGEKIEIIGEEGDWYKVKVNGKTGYASKSLIKKKDSDKVSKYETSENTVDNNKTTETEKIQNILKQDISLKLLPNFSSNDIKELKKGQEVELGKELNNWIEIKVDNSSGWILKNKLGTSEEIKSEEVKEEDIKSNEIKPEKQPSDNEKAEEKTEEKEKEKEDVSEEIAVPRNSKGIVNVETANVRAKADKSSSIIAHLDEGDEVTIVEEIGDWYKITNSEVSNGYVAKYLITVSDVTSRNNTESRVEETVTNPVAKGLEVVEFAKQYLGLEYVLGGKKPETGFDCSGFTKYVFKNFGYSLGSVAADQDTVGTEVSRENLKEGDLILFLNEEKSKIGHTGIYIGADQFIHAANPQRGVVIDNFSTNSYYSTRFVTARRIVE